MSSQTAAKAAQTAQALPRVISVNKKYTVQSTGIWERIRRAFAVDPTRSNGVPLNPQFRNPSPGANEPFSFIEPVTIPAGDIADNPYWKRDARRSYPLASVVSQGDVVGLLSVGSKAAPKKELIGEEGSKMLVAVGEEGKGGLAKFFEKEKGVGLLVENGLPPLPSGQNWGGKTAGDKYDMTEEQSYPEQYPCRTFQ